MSVSVAVAPAELRRQPLIDRLRKHVAAIAARETLTCEFAPGGRVRGAGVVSHFHCVHCNQSYVWHDIAAAIRELEREEFSL